MRTFLAALVLMGCGGVPENAPETPSPAPGQPPPAPPAAEAPAATPAQPLPFKLVMCRFEAGKNIGYYTLAVAPNGTASITAQVWIGGPVLMADAAFQPADSAYAIGPVVISDPAGDWTLAADRTHAPVVLTVTHAGQTITSSCDAR